MKFLVVEKLRDSALMALMSKEGWEMGRHDLQYKLRLQKKGTISEGGPFLDTQGSCYILDVKSTEELGDVLFESPSNLWVHREVHPLGTFENSLAGMRKTAKQVKK